MSFLRVLQWNTLSDQLSGFFPHTPPQFLEWDYRKSLIAEQLMKSKASILCLQEVDHFEDFYEPLLEKAGYKSFFAKKRGWHRDGICISYNSSEFSLEWSDVWYYPRSNQLALVCVLKTGSFSFLVLSTHLVSEYKEDVKRFNQVKFIIEKLGKYRHLPMILCGDFNAEPDTRAIKLIKNYFRSVYSETLFTNVYMREELRKKCIDYIWVKGFFAQASGELPHSQSFGESGFPSEKFPSDHFVLTADLQIESNEKL